jgi:hypothetical protein
MGKEGLLSISQGFNSFEETNLSFKIAQCIRMLMMILMLVCSLVTFFVLVRMYVLYLNAWNLAAAFITLIYVSSSAGRMVVESKMLDRMRTAEHHGEGTL